MVFRYVVRVSFNIVYKKLIKLILIMNEDKLRKFFIWLILAMYGSYMGLYVLAMGAHIERADIIAVTVCLVVVVGFIEIAVTGYKRSMQRFSRRIREIPMGKYRVGNDD